ncbi:MAG: LytTR family transcriptional regulator DNA-binding domain-containing protein [Bacteroidales bacterium]|nr:LytTR family transcriptional regulator DNA-binding domain-containing protein [Bacteroidales bacterium]
MRATEFPSVWNKYLYTAIQIFIGFVILLFSRLLFYHQQQRHHFTAWTLVAWIISEIVVISLVLTFVASFLNADENYDFRTLLWRVSLNIVSILVIPYGASVLILMLRERSHQIEELNNLIDKQQEQDLGSSENLNFYDRGGKLSFSTNRANVLYIEAADNYSNIHYINEGKEDTFILHNSMKQLDDPERYKGLLRCHRGYMVNIDNVKLLRKVKGILVLELTQGAKPIPVSRSYTERVVSFFAGSSSALP